MTGFVYAIGVPGADRVKIGFATNPILRLQGLRCGSAEDLRIIGVTPASPADERALHRQFAFARIRGEWFRLVGEVVSFVARLSPVAIPARKRKRKLHDGALARWLDERDITDEVFAERVGISRSMVTKLRHRTAKPSFDSARRIVEATDQKVTFDDLAPLAEPAPEPAS